MTDQKDLSEKFVRELGGLIEKYRFENHLESFRIINVLMACAKTEACMNSSDYHNMLGILTQMLNAGLKEMWNDFDGVLEKNEEKK